jgi:hypothetical protein
MRAIKVAAAALVLGGLSVPVNAQELMFDSWGSCNSYLNKERRAAARGSDLAAIARWDAAYCQAVAFKQIALIVPI